MLSALQRGFVMSINHFPFRIGDYLRKTRGLDAAEHGAYLLLLLEMYANGGSVADTDRLQHVCAVRSKAQWRKIKPVIFALCEVSNGVVFQTKVIETLQEIEKISEKRSEVAKRRFTKKPNKNNEGVMQKHSNSNANQKPKTIYIKNMGEEGTKERVLFDLVKAAQGEGVWASWFDDGRALVVGDTLYPKSQFFAKKIEQEFLPLLEAAGLSLGQIEDLEKLA